MGIKEGVPPENTFLEAEAVISVELPLPPTIY